MMLLTGHMMLTFLAWLASAVVLAAVMHFIGFARGYRCRQGEEVEEQVKAVEQAAQQVAQSALRRFEVSAEDLAEEFRAVRRSKSWRQ